MCQDALGYVKLRQAGSSRKILNGVLIRVTSYKIEIAKIAIAAKNLIGETDALKKSVPIEFGGQAHAGDNVSDGYRCSGLILMFRPNHLVGRGPLGGEALVEPQQNGGNTRIQVAQTL